MRKGNKKQIVNAKLKDEKKGYFGRLFNKKAKPGSLEYFAIEAAFHNREKGRGEGPNN